MHFIPNEVYHLYNRGNNKQLIFFKHENYLFLLKKIRHEWLPYCRILNYCLMPNHFHFMLIPNESACNEVILDGRVTSMQEFSKVIGKTLSSYTKAINKQNKTTGNLFQKKTKAKSITSDIILEPGFKNSDYKITCFHYIHQNPLKVGLVNSLEEWPYSSWLDYAGMRNGTLCDKEYSFHLTGILQKDILDSNKVLDENIIKHLF